MNYESSYETRRGIFTAKSEGVYKASFSGTFAIDAFFVREAFLKYKLSRVEVL